MSWIFPFRERGGSGPINQRRGANPGVGGQGFDSETERGELTWWGQLCDSESRFEYGVTLDDGRAVMLNSRATSRGGDGR